MVGRECECEVEIVDPLTLHSLPLAVSVRVQVAHQVMVELEDSLVEEQDNIVIQLKVLDQQGRRFNQHQHKYMDFQV